MKRFVIFLAIAAALLFGCVQTGTPNNTTISPEKYCVQDSDCACGVHIVTGDCFAGNAQYVDTSKQCPDFCTGIAGNFRTKCVDNVCTGVRV